MAAPPSPPQLPDTGGENSTATAALPECPRCGAAVEPLQEYCLECGLRLPEPSETPGGTSAWRRRQAGDEWAWPTLVALVVAVLAATAVVTIQATRADDEPQLQATTVMPTVTAPTTDTGQEPGTEPTAPPPTTAPTTATAPPPQPPPRPGLVSWPAGRNGHTVVLLSLPVSGGRAPALASARKALESGLPQVGVLESSNYSSLHAGYFVVFSGIYDSAARANAAAERAASRGYRGAYVRAVTT